MSRQSQCTSAREGTDAHLLMAAVLHNTQECICSEQCAMGSYGEHTARHPRLLQFCSEGKAWILSQCFSTSIDL